MNKAKFVKEIIITDPDTNGDVTLEVFKHEGGGMFAVDSSYLEQVCDEDTYPVIPDVFTGAGVDNKVRKVMLMQ
jgi:hypothetical protein